MHDPQHKIDQAEEKRREGLSRTAERVVAGLVGTGMGLISLVTSAHMSFREKLKDFALFEGMFTRHAARLEDITFDRMHGKINPAEFVKKTAEQKVRFNSRLNAAVESELGLASKGFSALTKGTMQRIGMMGSGNRSDVLFKTVVATTIGFAGTMMFFNSLHTRHTLDTLDDKVDALGDKLNAHAGGKGR